ncbi:hypothetical protein [Roseovarius sp. MMSF_3350]|uniref:hypothetical protein n=1 Tax=Roseovarius sp. MMSF_3350 TaxID=3046706 RepID=UPI00273E876F|nr:hypothetical protein [Roseovarius sp. MMSF_3350]
MTNSDDAQLGDEVQDVVSGFAGIVTAKNEFLNGCRRACVSPPVDKEGKFVEERWFDIEQLRVIQRGKVARKPANTTAITTGGERPDHPPR